MTTSHQVEVEHVLDPQEAIDVRQPATTNDTYDRITSQRGEFDSDAQVMQDDIPDIDIDNFESPLRNYQLARDR